jgi:hypothetical protein
MGISRKPFFYHFLDKSQPLNQPLDQRNQAVELAVHLV